MENFCVNDAKIPENLIFNVIAVFKPRDYIDGDDYQEEEFEPEEDADDEVVGKVWVIDEQGINLSVKFEPLRFIKPMSNDLNLEVTLHG